MGPRRYALPNLFPTRDPRVLQRLLSPVSSSKGSAFSLDLTSPVFRISCHSTQSPHFSNHSALSFQSFFHFCSQLTLLVAARFGLLPQVQLLVDAGADITHCSHNGWTPLHWAAAGLSFLASFKNNPLGLHSFLPSYLCSALCCCFAPSHAFPCRFQTGHLQDIQPSSFPSSMIFVFLNFFLFPRRSYRMRISFNRFGIKTK